MNRLGLKKSKRRILHSGRAAIAVAEGALQEDAIEPAAMLETDRLQYADARESSRFMQPYGSRIAAVADDRDHLAVAERRERSASFSNRGRRQKQRIEGPEDIDQRRHMGGDCF